jgi:chemotaxis protein MotA
MPFISTLLGLLGAAALFAFSIMSNTENYTMFLSLSSLALVTGGTVAATIVSYNLRAFIKAMMAFGHTLSPEKHTHSKLNKQVERIIEWNGIYRKQGLSAVLNGLTVKEKKNEFLTYAFGLMDAGYDQHEIKGMLSRRIEADFVRRTYPAKVLHSMAGYAPSFGMVGTIIGLIIMLDNMGGDITLLGKGLALALITTLYGVILGQLLFKPSAVHLFSKFEGEYFVHQVYSEGFFCILDKMNSMTIQDRLNSLLHPKAYYEMSGSKSFEIPIKTESKASASS